jgi:hypothetical protein
MMENQPHHSLGSVLAAALFAGLVAGLLVATFHLFATEPLVQRAIDLEEILRKASGQAAEPEVLSRSTQRVGLFLGYLLYGIGWGALFGVGFCLLPLLTRTAFSVKQGVGLILVSCWTIGIFPQLKYPANPPGVGEPATIGLRQELYVGILLLSILGAFLAAMAYQALGRGSKGWQRPGRRLPLVAALYLLYMGTLYVWLPNNPDPVRLPSDLMAWFRWLSVGGVLLFWLALGSTFVFFLRQPLFRRSPHSSHKL